MNAPFFRRLLALCAGLVLAACSTYNDKTPPDDSGYIHVSPTGSDTNDGSVSAPLFSLQKAVDYAGANGFTGVRLATGTYRPGSGLNASLSGVVVSNSGLIIWGGWDAGFTASTGKSTLDGQNLLDHVVELNMVTNIRLRNLSVSGGSNSASYGGGIFAQFSDSCVLTNCDVSGNTSFYGGGIYWNGSGTLFYCAITDNRAFSNGGGLFLNGIGNTIGGSVYSNTASGDGGGIYAVGGQNTVGASLLSNRAGNRGGGAYLSGNYLTVQSSCLYNSAFAGGGIYLFNSDSCSIAGLFSLNTAGSNGGGLWLSGADNQITAVISNNTALSGSGGGIFTDGTGNTAETNQITNNTPDNIFP